MRKYCSFHWIFWGFFILGYVVALIWL